MSSLFSGLSIARRALEAQQLGLEVTQTNIANANTPGYSRERVNFVPSSISGVDVGSGVASTSIESFRSRFADYRVTEELQPKGEQEAITAGLRQVEALLNEQGGVGLQSALSGFMDSFTALSAAPEDLQLRQQVLNRAGEFTRQARYVYGRIQGVQALQDRSLTESVGDVNSITGRIAELNVKVATAGALRDGQAAILRDERQTLIEKLAEQIEISHFETENGSATIVTRDGNLLVVGDQAFRLELSSAAPGRPQLMLSGINVTGSIRSGRMGGLVRVRDELLPQYLDTLDELVAGLSDRVNEQHALGRDYSGNPGGPLLQYTPLVPGGAAGAARNVQVALSDPRNIAAAGATGGPGSNENARALAGIAQERLFGAGTLTAGDLYEDLIFRIGTDLKLSEDDLGTQKHILVQLQNQRDAVSGVSLDEEAINIIRYQKAYEASARFVHVIDALTAEMINLIGV